MTKPAFTPEETMIVAGARALSNDDVCFAGIGDPSAAGNLARLTHAPNITLIYESGTIGAEPDVLPLSIADGVLTDTATCTVSVPEIFRYWLQGGRITVGFLAVAQLDPFGNINTTVVGSYDKPKVRLPGGGGAPEIASSSEKIFLITKQSRRTLVKTVDFFTSFGHGEGGEHRRRLGIVTQGPALLVTDLAVWKPDPVTKAFTVVSIHPGATREAIEATCGWEARYAMEVTETPPPTDIELTTLRALRERTRVAHGN